MNDKPRQFDLKVVSYASFFGELLKLISYKDQRVKRYHFLKWEMSSSPAKTSEPSRPLQGKLLPDLD